MDLSGKIKAGLNKIIFSTKPTGSFWATLSQILIFIIVGLVEKIILLSLALIVPERSIYHYLLIIIICESLDKLFE